MKFAAFFREIYFEQIPDGGLSTTDLANMQFSIKLRAANNTTTNDIGYIQMQVESLVKWQVFVKTPAGGFPPSLICLDNNGYKGFLLVDWSLFNNFNNTIIVDNNLYIGISPVSLNINTLTDIRQSPFINSLLGITEPTDITTTTENLFDILENYNITIPVYIRDTTLGSQATINVNSQNIFNGLQTAINDAIGEGKTRINVVFNGDTYYYTDKHIQITTNANPDLSIHFIGNGSTLIGSSAGPLTRGSSNNGYSLYTPSTPINNIYNCLLIDGDGNAEDFYSPLLQAKGLVEVSLDNVSWTSTYSNATPKAMRIPTELPNKAEGNCGDLYVQIYSQFFSQIYRVIKIENGYIYCLHKPVDGEYPTQGTSRSDAWTPNYGFVFMNSGKYPFYRLINDSFAGKTSYHSGSLFSQEKQPLYLCDSTTFLRVSGIDLKSITVSGLTFNGSSTIDLQSNEESNISMREFFNIVDAVLDFNKVNATMINVSGCTFRNIKGNILHGYQSKNLMFRNNYCYDYYKRCLSIVGCENVTICHNAMSNGNLRQNNDAAIVCDALNYHIAYNKLTDYGYCAIGVGRHIGWMFRQNDDDTKPYVGLPYGIVEYNETYMTPSYRNQIEHVPLMDGGAIYCWAWHGNSNYSRPLTAPSSRTYGTVIRHNFVCGHSGQCFNPGIYCDEGTGNVTLYGNMVVGIQNAKTIDYRFVDRQTNNATCNINKVMMLNILDNPYRFQGCTPTSTNHDNTNTIKRENILLASRLGINQRIELDNVDADKIAEDYVVMLAFKSDEYGISVPYQAQEALKSIEKQFISDFIIAHIREKF